MIDTNKEAVERLNAVGVEYVETGQEYYEEQYRTRLVKNLSIRAEKLGFKLVAENPTQLVRLKLFRRLWGKCEQTLKP